MKCTPLSASIEPDVSAVKGIDYITLSWDEIYGATSYAVYRVESGKFVKLAVTDKTVYTVVDSVSGTFLVQSYVNGKWSSYSSEYFATV